MTTLGCATNNNKREYPANAQPPCPIQFWSCSHGGHGGGSSIGGKRRNDKYQPTATGIQGAIAKAHLSDSLFHWLAFR
jgi:hypothetical protein